MNLESEYWGCGGAGGGMRDPYQQHFDQNPPHRTNCPEQEVTLAKISTLEDDYSKMKRALLSSMDEEEEEEEEEDVYDDYDGDDDDAEEDEEEDEDEEEEEEEEEDDEENEEAYEAGWLAGWLVKKGPCWI